LIEQTLKKVTIPKTIESLKLQQNHHLRQKELIHMKKLHYEKYKVAIEYLKHKNDGEHFKIPDRTENSYQLQVAIYKTMEEADSLLEILNRRGSEHSDSLKSIDSDNLIDGTNASSTTIPISAFKKPKDDATVIEELKTLNHQLQMLVFQLVNKLDESVHEADALKDRIKTLEINQGLRKPDELEVNEDELCSEDGGAGDSQKEKISPFSYLSNTSDTSPDVIESHELPALAPLELPNFDFNALSSKTLEESDEN
jgi:hypothetical protein